MLTLWGRSSSSNTQKVLWMLTELKVPFEFRAASGRIGPNSELLCSHDDPGAKPFGVVDTAAYGDMNPHRRIPTIYDPTVGAVVWESNTILRYLATQHGSSNDGVLGGESRRPADAAQSSQWMDWLLGATSRGFSARLVDQTARIPAELRDPEVIAAAYKSYLRCLATVEEQLERAAAAAAQPPPPQHHNHHHHHHGGGGGSGGNSQEEDLYLLGPGGLRTCDLAVGVELNRWSLCVHKARAVGGAVDALGIFANEAAPAVPAFPHLRRYYDTLMRRPAFRHAVFCSELKHQGLHSPPAAAAAAGGGGGGGDDACNDDHYYLDRGCGLVGPYAHVLPQHVPQQGAFAELPLP